MRNDYTEYLMHKDHKYLSKEWVKGKWQYIYDEKLGGKEKKAYEKAKTTNYHDKTLLKVRNNHLRDAVINRNEAKNELDTNQKTLSKYANKLSEASQKLKEAKSKDKNVFYSEVKRDLAKFDYDDANKAVSDSSVKYADSVKKAKNAQSEYSEASNNEFASGSKLKSAKKAYDKTALAKIDKLKSKGKNLIDKLFSKQNAKKNAAQKSAREEGMAQREREKQQQAKLAYGQRNAEKEQIKPLNALNKYRREHAYGEAEKQVKSYVRKYLKNR